MKSEDTVMSEKEMESLDQETYVGESTTVGIENIKLIANKQAEISLKAVGGWLNSINFDDYDKAGLVITLIYATQALLRGEIPEEVIL